MGHAIASFDVFDTCLARSVIAPSEVFRLVARALPADASFCEEDFISARVEAEKRARRASPREEVTLAEIWAELKPLLRSTLTRDELSAALERGPELELEAEASHLHPVPVVLRRIEAARTAGHRVIFVSDTYLPGDFVRRRLEIGRCLRDGDALYVSCEEAKTKRSGALFQRMLAVERVAPDQVLHLGDHPDSDFAVPRRLGLRAELFEASAPSRVERLLLARRRQNCRATVEEAGVHRLARLRAPLDQSPVSRLAEQFLGPFLCALGHWVLHQARARRIDRLYFAARDARLLHAVCEAIETDRDKPIDCRYLHVSRNALLLPASDVDDPASLRWLRRDFEPGSLRYIAGKLGLEEASLAAGLPQDLRERAAQPTLFASDEDWRILWRALQQEPLRSRLAGIIEERRGGALAYLRAQGVVDAGAALGFVDLGWYLTCQQALGRLRASLGVAAPLHGFYLGVMQGRLGPAEAGTADAVFRWPAADLEPDRDIRAFAGRETALEHIVGLADHPSVRGYTSDGSPIHASPSPGAHAFFPELHETLRHYARTRHAGWSALARDPARLPGMLAELMEDFFSRPDPAVAALLAGVNCSSLHGALLPAPLVRAYRQRDGWQTVCDALVARDTPQPPPRHWPEASRLLSSAPVKALLSLAPPLHALRRRIPR